MKSGRVSRTALKVAFVMLTLGQRPEWRARLPAGLADLTERLLLAAGVPGYGPAMIRWNKRPWAYRLSRAYESRMPGTFTGLGERKVFMNEQVLAALEAGATQVLNLGAGFDTLCLRLAPRFPQVRFIEVDHPATSSAKGRGVEREGWPENLVLEAADLHAASLSSVMQRIEGWDVDARSMVVAEGFFLYWTADDVRALFREIASCTGSGSRVAYSHGNALEQHTIANLLLRVVREPWLSSSATADLAGYMGQGWTVIAAREAPSSRYLEGYAVAEKV